MKRAPIAHCIGCDAPIYRKTLAANFTQTDYDTGDTIEWTVCGGCIVRIEQDEQLATRINWRGAQLWNDARKAKAVHA